MKHTKTFGKVANRGPRAAYHNIASNKPAKLINVLPDLVVEDDVKEVEQPRRRERFEYPTNETLEKIFDSLKKDGDVKRNDIIAAYRSAIYAKINKDKEWVAKMYVAMISECNEKYTMIWTIIKEGRKYIGKYTGIDSSFCATINAMEFRLKHNLVV